MKKFEEVLLIDDSKGVNILNKRLLIEMEVANKITILENGQLAIDYLKHKNENGIYPNPDLIFLDINMPVMDGYQFLNAYQNLEKEIKNIIVMLTTSISEIEINKAIHYKTVIGYHSKPLTKEKINRILNQINH